MILGDAIPPIRTFVVLGTRPEAIKMAPVIRSLRDSSTFETTVCVTGQHRSLLDQMLSFFDVAADIDLNVMRHDQSLSGLTSSLLDSLQPVLRQHKPDWVLVQGDTTTALTAALAGFYEKIRVGHLEAGLRTHNKYAPFPEEMNRRLIGQVADLHFAPTARARTALLAEGHAYTSVHLTGNTVIDSLLWTRRRLREGHVGLPENDIVEAIGDRRLVLVTAHRRESFDRGLAEIAAALLDLVGQVPDIVAVLPVHPNPNVRRPLEELLSGVERIYLSPPVDYGRFVWLMDRAELILTDSGGVQEEGSALGKPTLIMRDVTERTEAVEAGNAVLVGAHRGALVDHSLAILNDPLVRANMSKPSTAFGDGRASERVVQALKDWGR